MRRLQPGFATVWCRTGASWTFTWPQLLKGSVKKLHPAVRDILHMGLYQLLELDKIPDSAAVNESVRLARKYGPAGCEKLVNAVLRNAARSKDTLAQPTSFEDKYSHPAELVALLKTALPKGTLESVLQADNQAPETVIQVNTLKTNREALEKRLEGEGVTARPHKWMENCLVLSGTGSLEQLPSFREGLYYVQDPASKLSVLCGECKAGHGSFGLLRRPRGQELCRGHGHGGAAEASFPVMCTPTRLP